jgi:hypothetical protein
MRPDQKNLRYYYSSPFSGFKVNLDAQFACEKDVVESLPILNIPSPKHYVNTLL